MHCWEGLLPAQGGPRGDHREVFALMGLRQLYFLLGGLLERLV
jgi:hypothetical protein